jgi:hypothetical protein
VVGALPLNPAREIALSLHPSFNRVNYTSVSMPIGRSMNVRTGV